MEYGFPNMPFKATFKEFSKKQASEYKDWFISLIPERIFFLQRAVRRSPSHSDWSADLSPESLLGLGEWFVSQVRTRERTVVEMQELRQKIPDFIEISSQELSGETLNKAIDVGIYLSEVVKVNNQNIEWVAFVNNKSSVDYGQPVLSGFGKRVLNPLLIAVNMAYGVTRGTLDGERLTQLYKVWSDLSRGVAPITPASLLLQAKKSKKAT